MRPFVHSRVKKQKAGARRRAAISGIAATVLIVAATLIAFAAVAGYVYGIFGAAASATNAEISPVIFAPDKNIGVLNQVANFTILITNPSELSQSGLVEIVANGRILNSTRFSAIAGRMTTITLSRELNETGEWSVAVEVGNNLIRSYTFDVKLNVDDATLSVQTKDIQQTQESLAMLNTEFAGAAAVISVFAFAWPPTYERAMRKGRRRRERVRAVLIELRGTLLEAPMFQIPPPEMSEAQTSFRELLALRRKMVRDALDIDLRAEAPQLAQVVDRLFETSTQASTNNDDPNAAATYFRNQKVVADDIGRWLGNH